MASHRAFRTVGVAPFEAGQDRLVLLDRDLLTARNVDARDVMFRQPVEDAPAHGREQRVSGKRVDGRVEFTVERDEFGPA